MLTVRAVGGARCSASAWPQQTSDSVLSPPTVGENLQFSLGPTAETLQKPAACRSLCGPRCPRGHRSPPPPATSPGLRQAGSCTQSQSAPRQLSLPPGLTRAAMPRLSRFSGAGEGGWGAPGQPHGNSCGWGPRGHAKGRGDRPQPRSQCVPQPGTPSRPATAAFTLDPLGKAKAGMHCLSIPVPDKHRAPPIQQPQCRQRTG